MNVVSLRKNRFVRMAVIVCMIISVTYCVSFYSGASRNVPQLIYHLGNFETEGDVQEKTGPGEGGKPHHLRDDQQNDATQSLTDYGMNVACSDEISFDRNIPDTRLQECKYWDYPEDLPRTSVIIVFHNEGWSTLIRTIHSVINRTPPQFLEEILLIDDFSDKENLKKNLERYIVKFDGKVRLIRNKEREGLIRTRSRGAKEARGQVILFLDAHCEVNVNWLPPLLAPIYRNHTVMTVPLIDIIDPNTFEYHSRHPSDQRYQGIFDWSMLYKETKLPFQESNLSMPYQSPTYSGSVFAVDRAFFLSLGSFDPGLLIWGGDNLELSFKIWQCGGSILWVPCSRVGRVYGALCHADRVFFKKNTWALITSNGKRIVETWMDAQYKIYFYTREPLALYLNHGDISEQLALKSRLKCKSFQWYMENVAYNVLNIFPEPPPNVIWGQLCNKESQTCVSTMGHGPPNVLRMSSSESIVMNNVFRLNIKGQMSLGEWCIEANDKGLVLIFCFPGSVSGPWNYKDGKLFHMHFEKCLTLQPETQQIAFTYCDKGTKYKFWDFEKVSKAL